MSIFLYPFSLLQYPLSKNVLHTVCPKNFLKEFLERLKDILKTILLIEKYNSNIIQICQILLCTNAVLENLPQNSDKFLK